MPIHFKGSGGSQKVPEISVNSSGLITATAGKKSATKQLSSSMDADFLASNIKSGVNIFGVDGTMIQYDSDIFTDCVSGDGYIEFTVTDYFGEWPSGNTVMIRTCWVDIIIASQYNSWDKRFVFMVSDLSTDGANGWGQLLQLDSGLNEVEYDRATVTRNSGTITLRIESDEAFGGLGSDSSDDSYVYSVRGACSFRF